MRNRLHFSETSKTWQDSKGGSPAADINSLPPATLVCLKQPNQTAAETTNQTCTLMKLDATFIFISKLFTFAHGFVIPVATSYL